MKRKSRNVPNNNKNNHQDYRKIQNRRSSIYGSGMNENIAIMCFTGIVSVVFLYVIFFPRIVVKGDYLYQNNEKNEIILSSTGREPAVLEYVAEEKVWNESEEAYQYRMDHPSFLSETDKHPRVVVFYASWCGHCQHYAPIFMNMAKQVRSEQPNIHFHAISCPLYSNICKNHNVNGYPTILWFDSNNDGSETLSRSIKAKGILQKWKQKQQEEEEEENPESSSLLNNNDPNDVDDEKKSKLNDSIQPPKEEQYSSAERYQDASTSFLYALKNGIYMTNEALTVDQTRTLYDWLQILKVFTPDNNHDDNKSISIRTVATELLHNFDSIILSESNLSNVVSTQSNNPQWTHGCNHGDPHKIAYTCGLWELFHIITVGVAKSKSDKQYYKTPLQVADTLRDYIEHFFACEVCRLHFLSMYDSCQFQRCDRLSDDSSWRELALWLWEVHNDVNVRLYHEYLEEDNGQKPIEFNLDDDQKMKWPSLDACPQCWNEDNSWNEEEVFHYLEHNYWPEVTENSNVKVLRKDMVSKIKHSIHSGTKEPPAFRSTTLISVFGLACLLYFVFRRRKARVLLRKMRHKKPC